LLGDTALSSRAAVLSRKKAVLDSRLSLNDLELKLDDLLGLPLGTKLDFDADALGEPSKVPSREQALIEVLERSPSVLAAQQNIKQAKASLAANREEYIPNITGFAHYDYQSGIPFLKHNFGSYGVDFNYNLFDGGARQAKLRDAKIMLSVAETRLVQTRNDVRIEISNAYDKLDELTELQLITKQLLEARTEGYRIEAQRLHADAALPSAAADSLAAQTAAKVDLLTAAANMMEGTPAYWKNVDEKNSVLLVEFGVDTTEELEDVERKVGAALSGVKLLQPLEFIRETEAVELAWHIRDGLLGFVGVSRPQGTSLVIEDVCFPPHQLAAATHDLTDLLAKYGYQPAAAGHAAYGNLHFTMLTQFSEEESRQRYDGFMRELVELVVEKYDGSLKAEHGTGINMASFVRREWGDKLTDLMWDVKNLLDPHGILAPNVLLSRDPLIHLKNLKSSPAIEDVHYASHCIECGFCEPVCPSRNVTVTPRQRIVLRREMSRQPEWSKLLTKLQHEYEYDAIETCAVDGTCTDVCPMGINTGALMKHLRKMEHSSTAETIALDIAQNWGEVERLARVGVEAADIVQRLTSAHLLTVLTDVVRSVISKDLVPGVAGPMPHAAPAELPATRLQGAAAVYFPACINRIFGRDNSKPPFPALPDVFVELSLGASAHQLGMNRVRELEFLEFVFFFSQLADLISLDI
jgi:ferredoxin